MTVENYAVAGAAAIAAAISCLTMLEAIKFKRHWLSLAFLTLTLTLETMVRISSEYYAVVHVARDIGCVVVLVSIMRSRRVLIKKDQVK